MLRRRETSGWLSNLRPAGLFPAVRRPPATVWDRRNIKTMAWKRDDFCEGECHSGVMDQPEPRTRRPPRRKTSGVWSRQKTEMRLRVLRGGHPSGTARFRPQSTASGRRWPPRPCWESVCSGWPEILSHPPPEETGRDLHGTLTALKKEHTPSRGGGGIRRDYRNA